MKNSLNKPTDFYDSEIQRIVQAEGCTIYQMKNETGDGIITRYRVFPGIELFYNDFHMHSNDNENKLPIPDVMEINHCREGRFECELLNGDCGYLGEGDLSINMLTNTTAKSNFPLSYYHGISITLSLQDANRSIQKISEALGGLPIDLYSIQAKMCRNDSCFVIRKRDSVQRIFAELYTVPTESMSAYFKLKVMELLLFLNTAEPSDFLRERRYFNKSQVETVKAIHDYMMEHLDERFTLENLAGKFSIPITSMKVCFKGVYGSSIYAYMKACRLQAAALRLRQSNQSIIDIAAEAGYENPSKFSEMFRKEFGVLPSDYRKSLSE